MLTCLHNQYTLYRGNHYSEFYCHRLISFVCSWPSYKWSHTVYTVFRSFSNIIFLRFIHFGVYISNLFFFYCCVVCHFVSVCFMDIRVVLSFCLLWIKLLWTIKSFCGHMHFFLLGISKCGISGPKKMRTYF